MFLSIIWVLGCWDGEKEESETPQGCDASTAAVEQFALLPDSPKTQIHADLTSDGSQVWMVYNLPNEQGQFDVYLTSFDCAGERLWGPEQILAIDGFNQTTPRVAVSGDRVLVASQSDNSGAQNNLSIQLYLQNQDGTDAREWDWAPSVDGEEIGNHWLPSIVGTSQGFWIAAAAAHDGYFRTAVQGLDRDGEPLGDIHWVGEESYAIYPNIDARDDGRYVVGWETGEHVQWQEGTVDGPVSAVQTIEDSTNIRVLWQGERVRVFSTHKESAVVQLDGMDISQQNQTHFPNAASGENTVLYSHFRIQSGNNNDLYYGYLDDEDNIEADVLLTSSPPVMPYRPAVTHISDDVYFLAWSQGEYPDFELWGQVIDLSP